VTRWVRTPDELSLLGRALAVSASVALDTESDSLYHHVEKVCLVQIADDKGEACLVDPLVLKDLSPLTPVMADAAVVKVLHGADYDVTTLKRDFGFRFAGLFDTMIAARFLGRPQIGLRRWQAEPGVALEDSQRDDWSFRPLTATREAYALADAPHLLALYARLREELRGLGRPEWVQEESDAVAALSRPGGARSRVVPEDQGAARRAARKVCARSARGRTWRRPTPAFKPFSEALLEMAARPPRAADVARSGPVAPGQGGRAGELLAATSGPWPRRSERPGRARRPGRSSDAARKNIGGSARGAPARRRASASTSPSCCPSVS
jgi:ribonuclease D